MAWYFSWSDSLKKRTCRYLLQHYLGQYLQEKLSLDQLSVNLYSGKGTIRDIYLDVAALNEIGESHNLPIEVVDGYISSISVTIPWSSLLSDNSIVEIHGLMMTVQPKQRSQDASMFDSIWGSMTTSMQLAEECLRQGSLESEKGLESAQPLEGVELFAQTIETVLCRIKIRFIDTTIRLEYLPNSSKSGVALEIRIKKIDYYDEAGNDNQDFDDGKSKRSLYEPAAFSTKRFTMEGVTLFSDEFPHQFRTMSRSTPISPEGKFSEMTQIAPGSPEMPPPHSSLYCTQNTNDSTEEMPQDPIPFAVFTGQEELRLKLKHNESAVGAKVDIEFNVGPVVTFLSPRQINILVEVAKGLSRPDLEDSERVLKNNYKPMGAADYALVEQELQKQLNQPQLLTRGLQHQQGWSSHSLDDSDEEFLPMTGRCSTRLECAQDSVTDLDSSVSSLGSSLSKPSGSSCQGSGGSCKRSSLKSKGNVHEYLQDPLTELTQFSIRFSSLWMIILHEDILAPSVITTNSRITLPSLQTVNKMKEMAETFFNDVTEIMMTGINFKDFGALRKQLSGICSSNHLRVMATPITIEGNEKSSLAQWLLAMSVTVVDAEIIECLFDNKVEGKEQTNVEPEYCEVLSFAHKLVKSTGVNVPVWNDPCLRIKYHQMERTSQVRSSKQPNNSAVVQLGPMYSEIDISILDRIHVLLNVQPSPSVPEKQDLSSNLHCLNEAECQSIVSGKTDITLNSPFVLLCFRFPIPDLRPIHDMDRVPWWQRNLRKETLLMELTDASLNSTVDSSDLMKWEIQCRDAHGLFQESSEEPVSFLRACVDPNADMHVKDEGFDWPRLVLKANPVNRHSILETDLLPNNEASHSNSIICQVDCPDMSPFAARKVLYETDTPESVEGEEKQTSGSSCEADQVIMPADKYQIQDFIEKTMNNTRYTLEFTLPNLNIFLPSKHFYEVLYNRLSTDLVMWELSAPNSNVHCDNFNNKTQCPLWDFASQLVQESSCFQTFSMCKSALRCDSSSDSEDDNGLYYSIHEHWQKQKRKHQKAQAHTQLLQSYLSVLINVTQGKISLITPLRDSSSNVVPGQYGELQLHMEDSSFFFVSRYHGEPNNSFVCLQANRGTLYHSGMLSSPKEKMVGPAILVPPSHLRSTIYCSDPGIPPKRGVVVGNGNDSMDMLSVVVRVSIDEQNIKTFKVAVGISGATLRHYTTPSQQSWLTQFIDFFDIIDYPVAGYAPPSIMTELHLDLSSCAIDYRPLHLPLKTVIIMDNFSVSSNIAANTTTSVLRIIAEGVCLFISDKKDKENVDLRNDYVCVIDTDLFDLSLRMTDGKDPARPKLDLRASNNMVNVRTCADSCRALQNLITYFASDGDLLPEGATTRGSEVPLLIAENDVEGTANLSKSQVDHVHNLMAEAMKESQNGCYSSCLESNFNEDSDFEEENFSKNPSVNRVSLSPNISHENTITLQTEVDEYADNSESDDEDMDIPSADEEFCILEDDPGTGFTPRGGEPQVRLLTTEPVRLVENHFCVPVGRTDELKAPKNFPPAVWRYVLRQMSIKFHFYGGNDFDVPEKKPLSKGKEKHVTLKEDQKEKYGSYESTSPTHGIHHGPTLHLELQNLSVGFTNIGGQESLWTNISPFSAKSLKNNSIENWLTKGGKGRQHDVLMELLMNKLRFQHEIYPEKGEYASRQVLLIHDVEIRDRLASSQINKFLYQYASKTMPRQSHANMVVIKAVHTRPDPNLPTQECSLRVSVKPLRLNIDQDALLFLYNFFGEVCDISSNKETNDSPTFSMNTPHHSPVMGIASPLPSGLTPTEPDRTLIMLQERTEETQDLIGPLQDSIENCKRRNSNISGSFASPIYFRAFDFSPDVLIRVDYNGKRVDMDQGAFAGILMGVGQLNCCELKLKKLSFRHGLLGIEKLIGYVLKEWLKDIKRNQLPGIIAGLGPMYSLTQFFQGIRDLIYLPYEQFQKDGRLARGIKRGADSFYTSTAMAFLELANRLVQTIQRAAEFTYDVVSPGPSVTAKSHGVYLKAHSSSHPADIREGVSTAIQIVKEGLGDTARTIVRVASEEHEHKGVSGAFGAVVRQIPPTVVKPIILAAEATSNVLGGVRNHLAPDVRQEAVEKWRSEKDH